MTDKKFPVIELFGPTIEGEGSLIGMQTMFIRFGLCDYKCVKCDSMHAVDPRMVKLLAARLSAREIFRDMLKLQEEKRASHIRNITFSGGNPAIHDLTELVDLFQEAGYKIYVETQGTKCPTWLQKVDHVVVSPKSPGMGENFNIQTFYEFLTPLVVLKRKVTVKVVVFSAQDLEFAAGIAAACENLPWHEFRDNFYLSLGNPYPPQFERVMDGEKEIVVDRENTHKKTLVETLLLQYNSLCDEIMRDRRLAFAKFLPQLHVLVYGNETER